MVHGTGCNYTKVHKGYVGGVGKGKHTNLKCVTQKACLFLYKSDIPPQTDVVVILMLQRADHTCVTKNQRWGGGRGCQPLQPPLPRYSLHYVTWYLANKKKQEVVLAFNYHIARNFRGAKFCK